MTALEKEIISEVSQYVQIHRGELVSRQVFGLINVIARRLDEMDKRLQKLEERKQSTYRNDAIIIPVKPIE